jgi:hypothetical protein
MDSKKGIEIHICEGINPFGKTLISEEVERGN